MKKKNASESEPSVTIPDGGSSAPEQTAPAAKTSTQPNEQKPSTSTRPTKRGPVSINKMVSAAGLKIQTRNGKRDMIMSDKEKLRVPIGYTLLQYFTKDRRDDIVNVPADMITETYQMNFISTVSSYLTGTGMLSAAGEIEAVVQVIRDYFSSVGGQLYEQSQGRPVPVDEVFARMSYSKLSQRDEEAGPFLNLRSNLLQDVASILARNRRLNKDGNWVDLPDALPLGFVNHIIDLAIQDVERSVVRGVVGPATIRMRHAQELANTSLDSLSTDFRYPALQAMVKRVQNVYIQIVRNRDVNFVGTTLQQSLTSDPPIAHAMNILSYFAEQAVATVPVRLDYFMKHTIGIYNDINLARPYSSRPIVPGLLSEITEFHPLIAQNFRRYSLLHWLLEVVSHFTDIFALEPDVFDRRLLTRLFTDDPDMYSKFLPPVRVKDYEVSHLVEGYAAEYDMAVVHADASRIEEMFSIVAMQEFLTMVLRRETGFLYSRISALLDQRAIDRSTIWNQTIDRAIMGMSILFQSYLNAFSWMWQLLIDEKIEYADDNAVITKNIINIAVEYSNQLKTSTVPAEWAASIKQASLLFDNPFSDSLEVSSDILPDFVTVDESRLSAEANNSVVIYDPETRLTKTYYLSPVIQGSLLYGDHPSVDLRMFPDPIIEDHMYDVLTGYYALRRKYPERDLANPYLGGIFKYPNLHELFSDARFIDIFMDQCSMSTYKSAYDMSVALRIPMDMAEEIFDRSIQIGDFNLRAVIEWQGSFEETLVFDRQLLPVHAVYEYEPEAGTLLPTNDQMKMLWPEGMIWTKPNLKLSTREYVRSKLMQHIREHQPTAYDNPLPRIEPEPYHSDGSQEEEDE